MAADARLDLPQSSSLSSPTLDPTSKHHPAANNQPRRHSSVPHAHERYPARPHPSHHGPPSLPEPRRSPQTSLDQPSSRAYPSKPPVAVLRPDSAAYVESRARFPHPYTHLQHPRPQQLRHEDPSFDHPPRGFSPRTDPGPSFPRRASVQPSEPRSWQGDLRDPEDKLDTFPDSPSRSVIYSPDDVVIRSTYSDSDLESNASGGFGHGTVHRHRDATLKILLKLSTVVPFVSFACLAYTILILIFLIISSPLKLVLPKSPAFKHRTLRLLLPALNLLRSLVHLSRCVPPGEGTMLEDGETSPSYHNGSVVTESSTRSGTLITIQLLSPFISLGLMFAAWVIASFWTLSAFIQDDAVEKKCGDDDGKAYAKKMIRWWCDWLDGSVLNGNRGGSRSSRVSKGSRRPEMREQQRV